MFTEAQIDAAAAAAAEKANGGRFDDPLFYAPEHKAFWREVVWAALEAASAAGWIAKHENQQERDHRGRAREVGNHE